MNKIHIEVSNVEIRRWSNQMSSRHPMRAACYCALRFQARAIAVPLNAEAVVVLRKVGNAL